MTRAQMTALTDNLTSALSFSKDLFKEMVRLADELNSAQERVAELEKENAELKADLEEVNDNLQRACKSIDRRYDEIDAMKKELREAKRDAAQMHERHDDGCYINAPQILFALNRYVELSNDNVRGKEAVKKVKDAEALANELHLAMSTGAIEPFVKAITGIQRWAGNRWTTTGNMVEGELEYDERQRIGMTKFDRLILDKVLWEVVFKHERN